MSPHASQDAYCVLSAMKNLILLNHSPPILVWLLLSDLFDLLKVVNVGIFVSQTS